MSYCHLCGSHLDELEVTSPQSEGYCYNCENCDAPTHWRWDSEHTLLVLYVSGEKCPRCNTLVGQVQVRS